MASTLSTTSGTTKATTVNLSILPLNISIAKGAYGALAGSRGLVTFLQNLEDPTAGIDKMLKVTKGVSALAAGASTLAYALTDNEFAHWIARIFYIISGLSSAILLFFFSHPASGVFEPLALIYGVLSIAQGGLGFVKNSSGGILETALNIILLISGFLSMIVSVPALVSVFMIWSSDLFITLDKLVAGFV